MVKRKVEFVVELNQVQMNGFMEKLGRLLIQFNGKERGNSGEFDGIVEGPPVTVTQVEFSG